MVRDGVPSRLGNNSVSGVDGSGGLPLGRSQSGEGPLLHSRSALAVGKSSTIAANLNNKRGGLLTSSSVYPINQGNGGVREDNDRLQERESVFPILQ